MIRVWLIFVFFFFCILDVETNLTFLQKGFDNSNWLSAQTQSDISQQDVYNTYREIVALVEKGHFSEALPKLTEIIPLIKESDLLARARFLAGYCNYKVGSWKSASLYFEKYILEDKGILTDYARYYRAISLARGGDFQTAVGAWELFFKNHPSTRWEFEARISYAEALLLAGDSVKALTELKSLLSKTSSGPKKARILLLIGRCYEAQKKLAEAIKTYREIYISYPATAGAKEAGNRLKALNLNIDELSPTERFTRAEELYQNASFEEALEEFAKLLADKRFDKTDERGRKSQIRHAMCLYRLYRTDEAMKAFQSFISEMPVGSYSSTAHYYLGHCLQRKEKYAEAIKAYQTLIEKFPQSSLVPSAYVEIATILADNGQWEEAIKNLKIVATKYPGEVKKRNISFKLGWLEYRRGNYQNARQALLDHAGGDELTDRRNDYWSARALEKLGKIQEARDEYQKIFDKKNYDYYGVLAGARLNASLPQVPQPPPSTNNNFEADLISVSSLELDKAQELAKIGLKEFAGEEIADFEKHASLSPNQLYALALFLQLFGDYYRARRTVLNYLKISQNTYLVENDKYWRILYPQAFKEEVLKNAVQRGLDPNLVWAIILQESNFRPNAVSPAGAKGLMQIIPPTAKNIARRLGITDYQEADIFQPGNNILFGTTYLADIVNSFGDHPARYFFAIASYNGGPQNVTRWRRAKPLLECDEWVEEISFTETRNYVKKVVGYWAIYQMLYGKNSTAGLTSPLGAPVILQPSP